MISDLGKRLHQSLLLQKVSFVIWKSGLNWNWFCLIVFRIIYCLILIKKFASIQYLNYLIFINLFISQFISFYDFIFYYLLFLFCNFPQFFISIILYYLFFIKNYFIFYVQTLQILLCLDLEINFKFGYLNLFFSTTFSKINYLYFENWSH